MYYKDGNRFIEEVIRMSREDRKELDRLFIRGEITAQEFYKRAIVAPVREQMNKMGYSHSSQDRE